MSLLFAKNIGLKNFLIRGLKIRFLRKLNNDYFKYKLITNNYYNIYKWDPCGTEVYLTQCFTDWGNEYLFLDSIKDRKKGILIDVGCHTGYYSTLFKNYFTKVIGFEPSLKCYRVLSKLNLKNSSFFQKFVGDQNNIVKGGDSETGYSFFDKDSVHKQINYKEIEQVKLDDFIEKNDYRAIIAIKIDVDGNDLKVLYGAKNLIKLNRPSIIIENYSNELIEFFKELNYSLYSLATNKEKTYNLTLKKIYDFKDNLVVKMICCIPKEYEKNYQEVNINGNLISGINKKKILKLFDFNKV